MGSRLVSMLLVSGLLSFQGVLPLSARPVFDVTGIPSESSGRNSEVDDGCQHNLKSTGPCEDGTHRTFASQSTSSRSSQARRDLVDSLCLRGRQLFGEGVYSDDASRPGPNPPPGNGPPTGPIG